MYDDKNDNIPKFTDTGFLKTNLFYYFYLPDNHLEPYCVKKIWIGKIRKNATSVYPD